jgi:cytochrome c oxidase subunit 2
MHLYVIAFLFALVVGFMVHSIVVFRRKRGDTGEGQYFHGNTALEIVWTIVPLGVVLYFSVLGARYVVDITASEPNELVVKVTASQWNWRFDYPEYEISSNELFLPRNRQTLLEIISIDVIHSFWVPEFRVKQDAVPGRLNPLRITPTETGSYTLRCAEICGSDHAYMTAGVTVLEAAEFTKWVEGQVGPLSVPADEAGETADVERAEVGMGQAVAELNGCFKCHSTDGSPGDGPTWQAIFGTEETLVDGTTVVVDEEYIRRSILDPQAQIVAGYEDVDMPVNFSAVLTDADLDALVDFIENLGR